MGSDLIQYLIIGIKAVIWNCLLSHIKIIILLILTLKRIILRCLKTTKVKQIHRLTLSFIYIVI